ncbi:YihY/virulence factor BrkB family protein [Bacillus sp. FJAT-47783]|uniref:YihY/virulence factor BrkB family protein n=1 Tax=Bacillus sp. FJAT-47783 TaxID=2922712 RepID=UPI001FACE8AA|nr:YihY/virulence factor BrkB family protein [Bacillus sp. FJAT-47783]
MTNRQTYLNFFREIIRRFSRHQVAGLAAELAFFFLLSLFPFLIFLFTLLGFLPISAEEVLQLVSQYAPGNTMAFIESYVRSVVDTQSGKLLSLGIIGTLWSASNGINAIVRALNRAYNVEETRNFLVARGMAIVLTFAMIFVIIFALLLPVFGREIGLFISSVFGLSSMFLTVWNTMRWLVSFVILCIVFCGLYFLAPNKRVKVTEIYPGALFATVGWIVVSLAFSSYVGNFGHYSVTYGSLGGVIVLLIWFYLSGFIIILGGEINAIMYQRYHQIPS